MFVFVCVLIIAIIALYVNRIKRKVREKRNQEIFETKLWQQLRVKAHKLHEEYDGIRLSHEFVNACYAVHKFEWKEKASPRWNFPKRIKKYGYIKSITRKPLLRGKYNKWK